VTAVFGVDPVAVVAFLLLLGGVAGSFLPGVPAAVLSILGVLVYWWTTGFSDPGTLLLLALLGTGLLAAVSDWLGGVVAARVGGASTLSAVVGGLVGTVLLFTTGPLGMLVGAALTVFGIEYARLRDARSGAAAAGAYVVGFFASTLAQALLTVSILVAMVAVAL
jgi:uncharacterized protein YqgC (DUF456 family)